MADFQCRECSLITNVPGMARSHEVVTGHHVEDYRDPEPADPESP